MHRIKSCRNGCEYSHLKNQIWHIIAMHQEGICTNDIADWVGVSIKVVEDILEDLYVEEKIYFHQKTGRWHLEILPIH